MEDRPAAHSVEPDPPPSNALLLRLAARVAELERQVAALQAVSHLAHSAQSLQSPAKREPPPPLAPRFHPEPEPPPLPLPPHRSLETRIGSQVFNLIGIVALLIGAAWALKLAIEHGLLGPTARVLVGLTAGVAFILWSEHFRRKALPAFSYTLKAVGTGALYLSLWAAFQLYALLPAPVALGAMVLVTAWNAFMAWTQDAELLAGYALVGGLLTPLLLSTDGDHEVFLFLYLAVLVAAVVLLVRLRPWSRLLIPTFLAIVGYFIGYYVRFFHNLRGLGWDTQSTETTLFALIFAALFAFVSIRAWDRVPSPPARDVLTEVLLPLANAAFVALALYSVFEDSGLHAWLAWVMVALAAIYLGLLRLQKTPLAGAMHLACAVILLTVAIPLKASGQTLTTAWLVEGLVLYWASTRFEAADAAPSRTLALLSAGGYVLGFASVLIHWTWTLNWNWTTSTNSAGFFNANLGSALVAAAVFAGAVWLANTEKPEDLPIQLAALSAIDLVGLLLTEREVIDHPTGVSLPQAFANPDFFTALIGLALLAAAAWWARRIFIRTPTESKAPLNLFAAISLVLFNLAAILSAVREISALWTHSTQNEDLQRSLAISAFLMVYGAALLAAGFWRRNAFVRWQALVLILFTIAKVFLYDISGLSAGYRVVSFLALGALLLTVSYAYQRDWLNLKTPPPEDGART